MGMQSKGFLVGMMLNTGQLVKGFFISEPKLFTNLILIA
jgi:hypothetical protein